MIERLTIWQFPHQGSNSSVLGTPTPRATTSSKSSKLGLIVGVCVGAAPIVLIVTAIVVMRRENLTKPSSSHLDAVNFGPKRFTFAELVAATNNFSNERLLRSCGFGFVHRGSLQENQLVAIKRIFQSSTQGEREFQAEVLSIGRLRHRNLVSLLGWRHEKEELLLVCEFMANGSLDGAPLPQKTQRTHPALGIQVLDPEKCSGCSGLSPYRMGAVHVGAEQESLVKWVWSMQKKGQLLDVVDQSLQMNSKLETDEQVTRILHLGMLCILPDASLRPRTESLLQALKGDWSVSLPASSDRLALGPHWLHIVRYFKW